MLNEGVAGKDVSAIAQGFEGLGADFGNGPTATWRSPRCAASAPPTSASRPEAVLRSGGQTDLPADSFARIKNQMLAGFEYQKQNPGKLASVELMNRLYGDHPYAHSSDGTAESVPPSPWRNCARSTPRPTPPGNVVIALVGDLSRRSRGHCRAGLRGLPKAPPWRKSPSREPKASVGHIEFPSKQTNLMLAQLGIDRDDPDYAALSMGNQILGGGFGTRLMSEVREKRGLTYGVYSGSARCRRAARS
jgi:zinc protease